MAYDPKTYMPSVKPREIEFTKNELTLLRQAFRIASEDGSINEMATTAELDALEAKLQRLTAPSAPGHLSEWTDPLGMGLEWLWNGYDSGSKDR